MNSLSNSIPSLYVIATPIGNMSDISQRALDTLASVDIIACEDTRHTSLLLKKLHINGKKLISYYDQVEVKRSQELVSKIKNETISIALVSDAGTPCISDPGYRLVELARKENIPVIPIPGACAVTTLLSVSGLPCHRFLFVGFLPTKETALKQEFDSWKDSHTSIIFYEAANRLDKTLHLMAEHFPRAFVSIGRELTKLHEETLTTSMMDALEWSKSHSTLKGEVVVMVCPNEDLSANSQKEVLQGILKQATNLLSKGNFSHKDLMDHFSNSSLPKKALYQQLLQLVKDHKKS